MKYIGLTGGIGSGKTTIAKVFECLSVPVYYSDVQAKVLMNSSLQPQIAAAVGAEVYENGKLNTQKMAHTLFNNAELKRKVEEIVHPAVRSDFFTWAQSFSVPYVIMESALMFASNLHTYFNSVIYVKSSLETRTLRAALRDNTAIELIQKRIKMQTSDEIYERKSQYIIENNDNFVIPQVLTIHLKLHDI